MNKFDQLYNKIINEQYNVKDHMQELIEKHACCANCVYLSPEGDCEYRFEHISDDEIYNTLCDSWVEATD